MLPYDTGLALRLCFLFVTFVMYVGTGSRLQEANLQIKFVTNTTKESKRRLFNRLDSLGFPVKQDDFFTSLSAAHDFVKKSQLKPMLIIDDAAMEDFEDVRPAEGAELDSVVIGLAPELFNYEKLTEAFRYETFYFMPGIYFYHISSNYKYKSILKVFFRAILVYINISKKFPKLI